MILADFKLRPLKGSKFFFRIRIFDTKRAMLRAAREANDIYPGQTQAAFSCRAYPRRQEPDQGDIYLYDSLTLRQDAVHELTHAAVHYVRYVARGDLSVPNSGTGASAAEECLCRSMENLVWEFSVALTSPHFVRRLARFKNAGPLGGT